MLCFPVCDIEGAVIVEAQEGETARSIAARVLLEGTASLAAPANNVSHVSGKPLAPFDVIWKTLLPGWSHITSMTLDGKQGRMNLRGGDHPDPARLWLDKGDPTHGFSIHSLVLRGRDRAGRLQTRYAYLRWNRTQDGLRRSPCTPIPSPSPAARPGRIGATKRRAGPSISSPPR